MRTSLQWLIESAGLPVKTFSSAAEFLTAYRPEQAGCLLVDVRMPGMTGLELQAHLAQQGKRIPVIVITGHGDIAMAVRAMQAGAVDFIEKPFHDEALLASIRRALDRDAAMRRDAQRCAAIADRFAQLTPREYEVMELVTEGKSNKVIAATLGVSTKTVEAHRARVMDKMQARSLADLVRMALLVANSR